VTRLEGPAGSFFQKRHRNPARYQQERDAYRLWLPAVPEITPRMVAFDDAEMTLLLTAIDAPTATDIAPGSDHELDVQRAAGRALRRLHDVALPADSIPRVHHSLARRLRGWISRAGNLINAAELHALARAAEIMNATPMEAAACHLDYQPCNWLVPGEGRIVVIDFEHARIDARIRDLARLAHRHWVANPALKEAFLDSYGPLDDAEHQLLREFGAFEAITALVRGTERNNAVLVRHGRAGLTRLTAGA
jgi:tRNA A-37 threonylcarbamoyl transferase component Bud32